MKKLNLILILILLTLPTLSEARMNVGIVGGGVVSAPAGGDACATSPDASAGANLLCEDFEEADDYLATWTETIDTGDSIAGAAHSGTLACTNKGSKALQVSYSATDSQTWTVTDIGGFTTHPYVSFYINIVSESLADGNYATLLMSAGDSDVSTRVFNVFLYQSSGVLKFGLEYWDGASYSPIIGTTSISTGTWYKVDVYYNHAVTTAQLWVNDTSQGSASNTTDSFATKFIFIGTQSGLTNALVTYQIDNLKVDDTTRPSACPTS